MMEDIVLLYEGKRLYAGGSPKAARMRTDKTSEIRAFRLNIIKWSLMKAFQALATYRHGRPTRPDAARGLALFLAENMCQGYPLLRVRHEKHLWH